MRKAKTLIRLRLIWVFAGRTGHFVGFVMTGSNEPVHGMAAVRNILSGVCLWKLAPLWKNKNTYRFLRKWSRFDVYKHQNLRAKPIYDAQTSFPSEGKYVWASAVYYMTITWPELSLLDPSSSEVFETLDKFKEARGFPAYQIRRVRF